MNNIKIVFVSILLVFLSSCNNDDKVITDPCAGLKPITAEIVISERVKDTIIHSDTVIYYRPVQFSSPRKYDSYEWKIGYDDRTFSDSSVVLNFREPFGELPIRLIVKSRPDTECFPEDDGIDTLEKTFYVKHPSEIAILGSYIGAHERDLLDTFGVDIIWVPQKGLIINNINRGFIDTVFKNSPLIDKWYGNNIVMFETGATNAGSLGPKGTAILSENGNEIIINYSARDPEDFEKRNQFRYIGTRRK